MSEKWPILIKLFATIFIISIVSLVLNIVFYSNIRKSLEPIAGLTSTAKETKLILFYTPWFDYLPWPGLPARIGGLRDEENKLCPVSTCRITYNKRDFTRSNVVIFHGRGIKAIMNEVTVDLIRKKPKHQQWLWYEHENPYHIGYDAGVLNDMFDMTTTYRTDSDVYFPYGSYTELLHGDKLNKTLLLPNYARGRDKLALWIVSNCEPKLRMQIIKKLRKFISIDVYGKCSWLSFYWTKHTCKGSECEAMTKRYKFYFAFENRNCKDYITEKYWHNAIRKVIVPIVMVDRLNEGTLIPGSYINVLDYPNPKALANYLAYLDHNDTAYNEYFKWKHKYRALAQPEDWICKVCELIQSNVTRKKSRKIYNIGEFWGIKPNCYSDTSKSVYHKWLESGAS